MVKWLVLMMVLRMHMGNASPDLGKIRMLFQHAAASADSCKELLRLAEPFEETNPLMAGYRGAAMMVMSKHIFNPFNKLNSFNRGKVLLETAIRADTQSVELRFLRYMIQTNSPFFLSYRDKIDSDKDCLARFLKSQGDLALKAMIKTYLDHGKS